MIPKHITDTRFIGLFAEQDKETLNSKRIYNALLAIQYLLNQIDFQNKENIFFQDISILMEKYHIENYKRMGIPYPINQVIETLRKEPITDNENNNQTKQE